MAKKLILTQKQLDEIVGGNSAWLDSANSGFKEDGNNSVYTGEKLTGADAKPLGTDQFADELCLDYGPWVPGGKGGTKGTMQYNTGVISCSKADWAKRNLVSESNSELDNMNVSIGSNNINAAQGTAVQHAIDGKMKFKTARVNASRMKQDKEAAANGDIAAAQRYQKKGGDAGLNALHNATEPKAQNLEARKKAAMDRGESNAFQKPKTFNNPLPKGTAHTPKNNGNGILTFEQ